MSGAGSTSGRLYAAEIYVNEGSSSLMASCFGCLGATNGVNKHKEMCCRGFLTDAVVKQMEQTYSNVE